MKMKSLILLSSLLLLCLLVGWGKTEKACSQPCTCSQHNFSVDFREAAKSDSIARFNITDKDGGKDDKYIYFVSLCEPIKCSFDPEDKGDAAACQYVISQTAFTKLGDFQEITWDIKNQTHFSVMYLHGDDDTTTGKKRRAQVVFTLSEVQNSPSIDFVNEDDTSDADYSTYIFAVSMSTADAKAGQHDATGGTIVGIIGIVVMLLFVVAVALYFIIGSIVMYKVKGARGTEVIPNYAFWKDFPFLIKDGFMFTLSPCVKKFHGGYQSL